MEINKINQGLSMNKDLIIWRKGEKKTVKQMQAETAEDVPPHVLATSSKPDFRFNKNDKRFQPNKVR